MLATSVPVWLAVTVALVSATAAAISSIASLIMAIVNWRKLEAIHQTVRETRASVQAR